MEISVAVSHLLVVLNCSLNFILYCFKDSKFRKIVKSVMCHMGRWRGQQVTTSLVSEVNKQTINNKHNGHWKVTIAPNSLLMVDLVVVASSTGVEHLEDDEVML